MSPPPPEQRLPSVLEAAIKAEPKVEVERLPSPTSASDDVTPQARYVIDKGVHWACFLGC